MPSFKERFRPSRKFKKHKEAGVAGTDESNNSVVASTISINTSHIPKTGRASLTTVSIATTAVAAAATTTTATTGKTIDEHTGSAAFSTYHSYYLIDQCE
ncbi:unnamed protein product [Rotaria sp. Silwood2]|nr:unnamed protein product [Rotaria sp. Silwood2]CAF2740012.1 unnamed protein product [Rotaria sp. Silwood2]CAF3873619.1 unnamed protein product [Rotaria sp. Silwood2]CAF4382577.1 unnamed protein product [Rotaria sp. Silwood2]